ncbi:MAG: gamma-glutamyltransferase, partial [Proteobacteria bacterium]
MRDIQQPGRSVVMSTRGMVATSQPVATQVGLEILSKGGNAMDAVVAAAATLCVTEPQSTGIGGDCFLLYHEARSGKLYGLNGSGRAAAKATRAEFDRRGYSEIPERGILSVSVPGAIDAWQTAIERFGSMRFGEVLEPAIHFADEGYAVSPIVAKVWRQSEELLTACADTRATLLIDGRAPVAGTRHRQPNLAASLRQIARYGRDAFYKGDITKRIIQFVQANDGLLDRTDFESHTSEWVDPIYTYYRGLQVYELPPNGQGITVLMILNILENTQLSEVKHLSAEHIHTLTQAYRLAVAERDRFVADPAFSDIPINALLSKEFARKQWQRIDPVHA